MTAIRVAQDLAATWARAAGAAQAARRGAVRHDPRRRWAHRVREAEGRGDAARRGRGERYRSQRLAVPTGEPASLCLGYLRRRGGRPPGADGGARRLAAGHGSCSSSRRTYVTSGPRIAASIANSWLSPIRGSLGPTGRSGASLVPDHQSDHHACAAPPNATAGSVTPCQAARWATGRRGSGTPRWTNRPLGRGAHVPARQLSA